MADQKQAVPIRIFDLVPSVWFKNPSESTIWTTGYRMCRIEPESFGGSVPSSNLSALDVCVILFHGKMTYYDSRDLHLRIEANKVHLDAQRPRLRDAGEGEYLILLTPFQIDGRPPNEPLARSKVSSAVGLMIALYGRNIAFEHLFSDERGADGSFKALRGEFIDSPDWFPAPDISRSRLELLQTVDQQLAGIPVADRTRLMLSLRWFEGSQSDRGVDAFLKLWIAIETLAMPRTDIKPVKDTLSRLYGIDKNDTEKRFAIGRIFDLRSKVVHDGVTPGISAKFMLYLEGVYIDILNDFLHLPFERRAEGSLAGQQFDLLTWLKTI